MKADRVDTRECSMCGDEYDALDGESSPDGRWFCGKCCRGMDRDKS